MRNETAKVRGGVHAGEKWEHLTVANGNPQREDEAQRIENGVMAVALRGSDWRPTLLLGGRSNGERFGGWHLGILS